MKPRVSLFAAGMSTAVVAAVSFAGYLLLEQRDMWVRHAALEARQVPWVVFLKDGADRASIEESLRALPGARSLRFISKDEALETAKKDPVMAEGLSLTGQNPFPESFTVLWDPLFLREDLLDLHARRVSAAPGVDHVDYDRPRVERFTLAQRGLSRLDLALETLTAAAVVLALVAFGRKLLFAPVVLALLLLLPDARADTIRSRQRELKRLQDKISRKQRERRATDIRARELEGEVGRVSSEYRSSRRSLKEAEVRLREAERRRAQAEERLWASHLDVGEWNDLLSRELRRLYERRVASEAGRFMELAYRNNLAREKMSGVNAALRRHSEIQGAHAELAAREAEFQRLKAAREEEAERVRDARKSMAALLDTVQGRKAVLENELNELSASAKRFENLIQDLIREQAARESAARAAAGKEASARKAGGRAKGRRSRRPEMESADRGKLPWPVEGVVVERFGKFKHPELETVVVSNGIKIRPAQSSPVRAVGKGEALFAGEFMGYGLMTLVVHPDNLITVYAHLGRLAVKRGQRVSEGEVLGQTGTDAEEKPLLYFELRLHGEAMDPLVWLR